MRQPTSDNRLPRRGGRQWTVAQRCAVIPLDGISMPLENLALDPIRRYCAFDFWRQTGWVIADGQLRFDALSLGDTSVIALTDITDGLPAVVASDRHVSMDAVSVAGRMGIPESRAATFINDEIGIETNYRVVREAVRRTACMEELGDEILGEIRADYKKRGMK